MEVLHPRCAGLDVHSRQVTACVRVAAGSTVTTEHREFATTTAGLFELSAWLTEAGHERLRRSRLGEQSFRPLSRGQPRRLRHLGSIVPDSTVHA